MQFFWRIPISIKCGVTIFVGMAIGNAIRGQWATAWIMLGIGVVIALYTCALMYCYESQERAERSGP